MFWLTNLGANQTALAQASLFPISLWKRSGRFFIVIGAQGRQWGWCSATCAAVQRICAQSNLERGAEHIFNINEAGHFWYARSSDPVFFIPVPCWHRWSTPCWHRRQ